MSFQISSLPSSSQIDEYIFSSKEALEKYTATSCAALRSSSDLSADALEIERFLLLPNTIPSAPDSKTEDLLKKHKVTSANQCKEHLRELALARIDELNRCLQANRLFKDSMQEVLNTIVGPTGETSDTSPYRFRLFSEQQLRFAQKEKIFTPEAAKREEIISLLETPNSRQRARSLFHLINQIDSLQKRLLFVVEGIRAYSNSSNAIDILGSSKEPDTWTDVSGLSTATCLNIFETCSEKDLGALAQTNREGTLIAKEIRQFRYNRYAFRNGTSLTDFYQTLCTIFGPSAIKERLGTPAELVRGNFEKLSLLKIKLIPFMEEASKSFTVPRLSFFSKEEQQLLDLPPELTVGESQLLPNLLALYNFIFITKNVFGLLKEQVNPPLFVKIQKALLQSSRLTEQETLFLKTTPPAMIIGGSFDLLRFLGLLTKIMPETEIDHCIKNLFPTVIDEPHVALAQTHLLQSSILRDEEKEPFKIQVSNLIQNKKLLAEFLSLLEKENLVSLFWNGKNSGPQKLSPEMPIDKKVRTVLKHIQLPNTGFLGQIICGSEVQLFCFPRQLCACTTTMTIDIHDQKYLRTVPKETGSFKGHQTSLQIRPSQDNISFTSINNSQKSLCQLL